MKKKKPFIFINAAMSVDGKISTYERRQVRISSKEDMLRVDKLRAGSDAVLVGMNTVLIDDPKLTVKSEKLRKDRVRKGLPENPMKVTIGRIDSLSSDSEFMSYGEAMKVIFASADSDPYKIEELAGAAKIYVSEGEIDYAFVAETLYGLGVRRLMVEGGSTTNYRFLKAGLVDELYVTVGDRIFGGVDAPSLVDGEGFPESDSIKLKILSVDRAGDELVIGYKIL